jgi:hypothetical protein
LLQGKFFDQVGEIHDSYEGRDSALATLKKAIDRRFPGLQIVSYQSGSVGGGISAQSLSTIIVADAEGRTYTGTGEDSDIEISAMRALIDGTNRAFVEKHFKLESNT